MTSTITTAPASQSPSIENTRPLLVRPIATSQEIQGVWAEYLQLKASLLGNDDYQEISVRGKPRRFMKKSGFRKLATAFCISTDIIREERKDLDGYFVYEITCRAIAPNGRYATACASCASNERSFSHVENDTRATSQTRATNRAIADILGEGVSAEEMAIQHDVSTPAQGAPERVSVKKAPPAKPKAAPVKAAPDTFSQERSITPRQQAFLIRYVEETIPDEAARNQHFKRVAAMSLQVASQAIQDVFDRRNKSKAKRS